MQRFLDLLSERAGLAFEKAGIEATYGRAKLSDRPELCEFQTNGALSAAKQYKKNPMEIAESVVAELSKDPAFSSVSAVRPGFVNFNVSNDFLLSYIKGIYEDEERLGVISPCKWCSGNQIHICIPLTSDARIQNPSH